MSDLDRLFYWRGIAAEYQNYRGEKTLVSMENRLNLLRAMGVEVENPEALEQESYRLDVEPWKHWFPSLVVVPAGDGCFFDINIPPTDSNEKMWWRLNDEAGIAALSGSFTCNEREKVGEYASEGENFVRYRVPLGHVPPNYYQLSVSTEQNSASTQLAAFPSQSWQGTFQYVDEKVWGVIVQLYSLRSARNWGIGDFTDLHDLIRALVKKGANVVGLNPLHALSPYLEDYFSPYSPSDRCFINPLYIDPHRVTDFGESVTAAVNTDLLAELRKSPKVNYFKVRALKYPVFQSMFEGFIEREIKRKTERARAFFTYVENGGDCLLQFAHFEATHQTWPGARFVIRGAAVLLSLKPGLFTFANHDDAQLALLFHCYLQWLADAQLASCQDYAIEAGMTVGLIRDLAVGADGGCAEVSANPQLFCRAASVGAPPDPFAQTGQNWGLPPMIPSEMRRTGFEHFRKLLRLNMRNCGALRIDHAMSLARLWWCPPAKTANYGAYVYYPEHEMFGLLLLESYLNKCLVIAEDLGVVLDEFRQRLTNARIFTNKVFYFEREFHDRFKAPQEYDAHALAMVNNHDLPSLVSWWNGSDLVLRNELNLFEEGVSYEDMSSARKRDKENILTMLYDFDLYPVSWHGRDVSENIDEALVEAILLLTSRTSSKIFVLQLEDLLLMDEPINVPGTFKEYDNWQRKISRNIADIFSDPRINTLLAKIDNERRTTELK